MVPEVPPNASHVEVVQTHGTMAVISAPGAVAGVAVVGECEVVTALGKRHLRSPVLTTRWGMEVWGYQDQQHLLLTASVAQW